MSRQLRPRKSRPSYTPALFDDNADDPDSQRKDEASNKDTVSDGVLDDPSSGSDFDPDDKHERKERRGKGKMDDGDSEDLDEDEAEDESDELEEEYLEIPKNKAKSKAQAKKKPQQRTLTVLAAGNILAPPVQPPVQSVQQNPPVFRNTPTAAPSVARRNFSKLYSLPTPNVNHRHRAVPLFTLPNARVSRLTEPPKLFEEGITTDTNGFTSSVKVIDKVSKAWGYNVGPGPLWDLVEDRSWFKESGANQDLEEGQKRPRVHQNVNVKSGWRILSHEQANPYLPTDVTTTEGGQLKPPSPVVCSFGPYGKQTKVELPMFAAFPMAKYIPESKAHIFNAGSQVWALDWCPIFVEDRKLDPTQYLAVAPFPSASHSPEVGRKKRVASLGCIQLWSLSPTRKRSSKGKAKAVGDDESKDGEDIGKMACEVVLCFDSGPVHAMKWVPLPTNSDFSSRDKSPSRLNKLGLLSATFEDGSFAIHAVPDPVALHGQAAGENDGPIFVHLPDPILRIDSEEDSSCWSLDWANSELVAIGTTSGTILVYNLKSALQTAMGPDMPTLTGATHPHLFLPTHCITVHQSAIRALVWMRAPSDSHIVRDRWEGIDVEDDDDGAGEDPTVIASGGYDGMACMTDIREGRGVVMNRTRDVINAMTHSPFVGGPVTIDHENIVKAYSASPRMLGRGHLLLEPQGPVWHLSASDYHPQLAVGTSDGSCLTTNMLRSARRSGSVPFFVHKIYQMDYSRNLKEYRMLDRFLPQETQEKPTAGPAKAKPKKKPDAHPTTAQSLTGAWPREVGIHVVAWNSSNGLSNAGLLASATASGLCRIDWLWGRWMKGKIPYHGMHGIRGEEDGSSLESVDSG